MNVKYLLRGLRKPSRKESASAVFVDYGVSVTVEKSSGSDDAIVIQIDTEFEPDGSDGGPGLRVFVNDGDAYIGVAYRPEEL